MRKVKTHLELNLAKDLKDKKGFLKYIIKKKKTRENVGLLPNDVDALVTENAEKVELLKAAFASVSTAKTGPQEPQSLEIKQKVWEKEDSPLVEEDWIRNHLGKLDAHKSLGPDGMHPWVLKEQADIIAQPLSITFEKSWRTGGLEESKCHSVFKKIQGGGHRKL